MGGFRRLDRVQGPRADLDHEQFEDADHGCAPPPSPSRTETLAVQGGRTVHQTLMSQRAGLRAFRTTLIDTPQRTSDNDPPQIRGGWLQGQFTIVLGLYNENKWATHV
jgi:hypothetical protein